MAIKTDDKLKQLTGSDLVRVQNALRKFVQVFVDLDATELVDMESLENVDNLLTEYIRKEKEG